MVKTVNQYKNSRTTKKASCYVRDNFKQENVKVSAKVLIFRVCGDLKIRISQLETISNFEYQMTKICQALMQYLWRSMFEILNFGHSYLLSADASLRVGFRASCFEFIEIRTKEYTKTEEELPLYKKQKKQRQDRPN